jgi:acetyl esterase/lipase
MSLRMAATRLFLRTLAKPRMARLSIEQAKRDNLPDPPPEVERSHAAETVELGGVRAVWLDRERAAGSGAIVWVHGGSFVSGPYRNHWQHLSRLVSATGMAGLMVDYRLAPEHPFPAAPDDCVAAIAAAAEAGELRPQGWAMIGDGSGGGLALAVCAQLRDGGLDQPGALVLVSPEFDLSLSNPEVEALGPADPMMSIEAPRRWNAAYVAGADWRDPRVSPLFGDPAGLPPTLVQAGSTELLVPDIRSWCAGAQRAGVEVAYVEEPGGFHDFAVVSPRLPEARRAHAAQIAFIRDRTVTASAAAG